MAVKVLMAFPEQGHGLSESGPAAVPGLPARTRAHVLHPSHSAVDSARTQDSPPCSTSSLTPGWNSTQDMFTLTLAPFPSPERTLTFTSAFRCNGMARVCSLKRP